VSGNAKAATADLASLRAEVDASLRKVSSLIDEINRKWPFQRDSEIRLP
jgi:phospholipid/cholesterol/gamma-HCH transport system substrate-binding protein